MYSVPLISTSDEGLLNDAETPESAASIVENSGGAFYFENDTAETYPDLCSNSPFTWDGVPAQIVGGAHPTPRPR